MGPLRVAVLADLGELVVPGLLRPLLLIHLFGHKGFATDTDRLDLNRHTWRPRRRGLLRLRVF